MLSDQYPANSQYEYGVDDILLVINSYIIKNGYRFKQVLGKGITFETLMNKDQLTVIENGLPCYLVNNDKYQIYDDHWIIVCGDSQFIDFEKTGLYLFIKKAINENEKYICIFPFHIGHLNDRQGGHWNLAALEIDGKLKTAKFTNIEPLLKGKLIITDCPNIVSTSFYQSLKRALYGFKLTQVTHPTNQQMDAKTCGAIAAENSLFYLYADEGVFSKQYHDEKNIHELRKKHINLCKSDGFAKRQFNNWIFTGFKNDDFDRSNGEALWEALRKLQLLNPGKFADDLLKFLKTISNDVIEPGQVIRCLADLFKAHKDIFDAIIVDGKPFSLWFFKQDDYNETVSEYNVIEVLKCLVIRFEGVKPKKITNLPNNIEPAKEYKRNQGYSNTYRGDEYQKVVGMHFALKAYLRKQNFTLRTESAEKDYQFGKFDDLVITTENEVEVVQIKHAGSIDEKKKIYTVDMLSATDQSKTTDIGKKTALHIYYDSWRQSKDSKKKITFRFYTNHALDDDLKSFYDDKSKLYLGLLKEQSDENLRACQKKIFDSIYHGSEYFSNNIADALLQNIVFVTPRIKNEVWQKFIDDNIELIYSQIRSYQQFKKTKELSEEQYQKIAFLLIGHFEFDETEYKITVPNNYFTSGKKYNQIHQYLFDKLVALKKNKKSQDSIEGLSLKLTKGQVSIDVLIKILFNKRKNIQEDKKANTDQNRETKSTAIMFPAKQSVHIHVYNPHAIECLSYLFGFGGEQIPYDKHCYNLDALLKAKLAEEPTLPRNEFTDIKSLDTSIGEFINAFNFHIEQPSIEELEKQNYEQIRQYFQIEDRTYFLKFEEYFLKNFRAPIGELITFATLDKVFQEAKQYIQKNRLIGHVQRYIALFKSKKKNIVSDEQCSAIDKAYHSHDNVVTIITGSANIGKSFTVLAWLERKLNLKQELYEDNYAFLPVHDIWETDIDLFRDDKIKLLIIDNVEAIFDIESKTISLEQIIAIAKDYRKKLVLIINENKMMSLAAMLAGIHHEKIECKPLTAAQVYKFADVTAEHFLNIKNLNVKLHDLLQNQQNSGMAKAMCNPGFLKQLLHDNFIINELPVSKEDDKSEIYIKQDVIIKDRVNFVELLKVLKGTILVIDQNNTIDKRNYLNDATSLIDMTALEWPKAKLNRRLAIKCKSTIKLTVSNFENLKERNDLIVIVSTLDQFNSLAEHIGNQCYAPDENSSCIIIKLNQVIDYDKWLPTPIKDENYSYCEQRGIITKRLIISAEAGMGKSTLTKRLTQMITNRSLEQDKYHWRVPIYLDQLNVNDRQKSINQYVFDIVKKEYKLPDYFHTVIEHDLSSGNVLLILDGGDQIKEEQISHCRDLYKELISHKHAIFLTRPDQSKLLFDSAAEIILQPFTDAQIEEYFHRAFPKPKVNPFVDAAKRFMRENINLRQMLGIPLQCYLFWQAWQPYYQQWRENSSDLALPSNINGDTALVAIFQRYLEAKFYIHFKRNLKISGSLLDQRERVNTLSIGYVDRFAHVSVWEHFADIRPYLSTNLSEPIPQEWLDNDITEIALVKRVATPKQGAVSYVLAHRTYQEYAAAKFFVEGLTGLRQIHAKQKKWCKELLSIARFVHTYQQFWRFVLNWIKHHILLNHLPKETLKNFENAFKENDDLIQSRELDFWRCLISQSSEFPPSLIPDSGMNHQRTTNNSQEDKNESISLTENVHSVFTDEEIEQNILNYHGETFMRHDSDVYRSIDDLPNHAVLSDDKKLSLIKHAYKPNGNSQDSFRIHEAIARCIKNLRLATPEFCEILFGYFDKSFDRYNIAGYTRHHVLQAAKTLPVKNENLKEFEKLLKNIAENTKDLNLITLATINHIFENIFVEKLYQDNNNLYDIFEKFIHHLNNTADDIRLDENTFDAISKFIMIMSTFSKKLKTTFICKITKKYIGVMIIYAQFGKEIYPNKVSAEDKKLIDDYIKSISKDNIDDIVMLLANKKLNANKLLKIWMGIKYDGALETISKYNAEAVEKLQEDDSVFKRDIHAYSEVDGAIPATCELQQGFNHFMAGYLIYLMNEKYWQYPRALVKNIPRLLKYHVDNGIYVHLALHVYLKCLTNIVIPNGYEELFSTFFNNSHVNVYSAMDYAWNAYVQTNVSEGASVISILCNHLHWPLFKSSQALSLQMVTPGTGDLREFKAKDKTQLGSAISFFKKTKESRIEHEKNTESMQKLAVAKKGL